MTAYSTHRFSVGLRVLLPRQLHQSCKVIAQITRRDGPEYRIALYDGHLRHKVGAERELTYRTE